MYHIKRSDPTIESAVVQALGTPATRRHLLMTQNITLAHVRSSADQAVFNGSTLPEDQHAYLITGQGPGAPVWGVYLKVTDAQAALPAILGSYPGRLVTVHPRACFCSGPDVPPSLPMEPDRRRELLSLTHMGRAVLAADETRAHREAA